MLQSHTVFSSSSLSHVIAQINMPPQVSALSLSANHHWMKIILVINLWFIWRNNESDHFHSLTLAGWLENLSLDEHSTSRTYFTEQVDQCESHPSKSVLHFAYHYHIWILYLLHEVWWNITHMSVFVALRTIFSSGAELITSKTAAASLHISYHPSLVCNCGQLIILRSSPSLSLSRCVRYKSLFPPTVQVICEASAVSSPRSREVATSESLHIAWDRDV